MRTPIRRKRVWVGSRLRILRCLVGLVGASSSVGCHKNAPDKVGEAAPDADSVKKSLAALRSRLGELQAKFATLRKQVEAVPPDLPRFREVRANFYAIEEARGITDAKVTLLSSRFESALASRKSEELRQISKEVAETYDEIRQFDQLHIAALHQVMALQRLARREKEAAAAR
jgi:hypothetical protein